MNLLAQHSEELGIHLTPKHIKAFGVYQRELLDWNQRVNLTAITQENHIEIRHFLDSLTCLIAVRQFLPASPRKGTGGEALRLLDVGAGAGFPGIPLKIVCPEWHVTLLEATGKKVQFLEHMRDALGLKGMEVIHGRAEDLARDPAHRERYDWVTARAVAEMPVLAELTLPFARIGGLVVAMKAATAEAEAAAAGHAMALLGGELAKVIALQLPGLAEERRLVVVRKTACTPDAYPRRAGMPAKRPLK